MQQEASRKLGFFHIKKTMMVAQQLYEGIEVKGVGAVGLVTYIRTDSTRISEEAQNQAAKYIKEKFGESYLPKEKNVYKNKSASQDAHECIRPTSVEMDPESVKDHLPRSSTVCISLYGIGSWPVRWHRPYTTL